LEGHRQYTGDSNVFAHHHDWCSNYKDYKIGKVSSSDYTDIPNVFFKPYHVGHCCTNVNQGHCCAVGYSCTNMIRRTSSYAPIRSNKELSSHCCATVLNKFLHYCAKRHQIMEDAYSRRKNATDRQTWIGHKVNFGHARAWRKPKICSYHLFVPQEFPFNFN
jgi:hypothetical protein